MMHLKLAIQGNLRKQIEADIRAGEKAITAAIRHARDGAKADLRGMTAAGI